MIEGFFLEVGLIGGMKKAWLARLSVPNWEVLGMDLSRGIRMQAYRVMVGAVVFTVVSNQVSLYWSSEVGRVGILGVEPNCVYVYISAW